MVISGCVDHRVLVSQIVRKYTHLSIDPMFLEIFDEVARRLETRTLPRHTRSGFVNKAARMWVDAVKDEQPELRQSIEEIERRHETQTSQSGRPRKAGRVLQLKTVRD